MRLSASVICALLSSSLASPRPDPKVDPGYRVVNTDKVWVDDKNATRQDVVDKYGRTCTEKLMLTEYTDYTEEMTCI